MLAWQRTALAIAAGSLVYGRVASSTIGISGWFLSLAGLLVAFVIARRSRRRYSYVHRTLTAGRVMLPDGLLPAILAGALGIAGTTAVVVAVLDQLG